MPGGFGGFLEGLGNTLGSLQEIGTQVQGLQSSFQSISGSSQPVFTFPQPAPITFLPGLGFPGVQTGGFPEPVATPVPAPAARPVGGLVLVGAAALVALLVLR